MRGAGMGRIQMCRSRRGTHLTAVYPALFPNSFDVLTGKPSCCCSFVQQHLSMLEWMLMLMHDVDRSFAILKKVLRYQVFQR